MWSSGRMRLGRIDRASMGSVSSWQKFAPRKPARHFPTRQRHLRWKQTPTPSPVPPVCRLPGSAPRARNTATQAHQATARTATTHEHVAPGHHHHDTHPQGHHACHAQKYSSSCNGVRGRHHRSRWALLGVGKLLQASLASFCSGLLALSTALKALVDVCFSLQNACRARVGFLLCSRNSSGVTALFLLDACWVLRSKMAPEREPQVPY